METATISENECEGDTRGIFNGIFYQSKNKLLQMLYR
jgi:hypothetical protein